MPAAIETQLQQDRAYSLQRGVPGTPSSGDWGAYATGIYRTPTTQGYSVKSKRCSHYNLTHRNKHREAIKMWIQRKRSQMKEQENFQKNN